MGPLGLGWESQVELCTQNELLIMDWSLRYWVIVLVVPVLAVDYSLKYTRLYGLYLLVRNTTAQLVTGGKRILPLLYTASGDRIYRLQTLDVMEDQKTSILQSDSPIKATATGYVYDGRERRKVVIGHVKFHTVPLPVLLGFMFPFLQRGYVANVVDDLTHKGVITEQGWQPFLQNPLKNPSTYQTEDSQENDDVPLRPLETIFDQVALSIRPNEPPLVSLSVHGPQDVSDAIRSRQTLLDGSIHLRHTGARSHPSDKRIPYHDIHICLYIHGQKNGEDENPRYVRVQV